jgi:hypothetical protein
MLLQVLGYHHLASRTSSRDDQPDPTVAVRHLGTLADLLGVSLSTFRQIHRSAGVMGGCAHHLPPGSHDNVAALLPFRPVPQQVRS